MVVNPGTGGVIQRRARARPNDCTLPASASVSSARCTERWLVPSARARAELDHASPSTRKASTAPCSSSSGRARPAPRWNSAARVQNHEGSHSRPPAFAAACEAALSPLAIARDAIHRRTSIRRPGQPARPSARHLAMLPPALASANNTGRVASETIVPPLRTA